MNLAKTLIYAQGFFICLMLIGFICQRFSVLPFKAAFGAFAIAMILAALVSLVAIVVFGLSFGPVDNSARASALGAFVLGLAPLVIVVSMVGSAQFKSPRIHDISTSPGELEFTHAQTLRSSDENSLALPAPSVVKLQKEHYPDIQPIRVDESTREAYAKSLRVAEDLGWVIAFKDEARMSFEAYEKTAAFGFVDDVLVKVTAVDDGSQIDLRSVSRVGLGDLGANAKRIASFQQRFISE